MDFLNLLDILFFSFTVVQGKAIYFTEGSSGCDLASPPIYYTENGTYVNLSRSDIDDMSGMVKENAVFRIGYDQQYVVFSYKGCALVDEIQSRTYNDFQNSVGRCYSRCRTEMVGLQENICHCIDDTLVFQKQCDTTCVIDSGSLCGSSNLISVYTKVRSTQFLMKSQLHDDNGNCLAFAQTTTESNYYWAGCNLPYRFICQKDDMAKITERFGSWTSALRMCLSQSSLLVNDIDSIKRLLNRSAQQWTGFIRSFSINQLATTSHSSTHKVSEQRSTTLTISPYTSASEADSRDNRQDMDSEAVILYTVIPVSLVIILGIVGFILWRRGSFPFCRQTNGDFDENMSSTTTNTKLESEPYSEAQQQDYFVLKPQGNYDSVEYIKEHDRTEDYYDSVSRSTYNHDLSITNNSPKDFKEDDYDTTTTVSKPLEIACAMSSVYDRFDHRDTYNHIDEVKGMHAKLDDTYDQPEPKKDETMYDTTSTVSKTMKVVDYRDDMYSKVLRKK